MKNVTKIIIGALVLVIIAGYGGYKYGQSSATKGRQGQFGTMGGFNSQGGKGVRGGASGVASGDIIKKDDQSLTLKLRDGGSKIIWFATSTEIQKMAPGSAGDLLNGKTVMVNGSTNSDGSIVAKSIQLRSIVK